MDLDRQLAVATQTIYFLGLSRECMERNNYNLGELLHGDLTSCPFYPPILTGHQSLKVWLTLHRAIKED